MALTTAATLSDRALGLCSLEEETNIRFRFVVGRLQEPADQAILEEEQHTFQDFLVLDVTETYENMVLKVSFHQQAPLKHFPGLLTCMLQSVSFISITVNNFAARGSVSATVAG